MRLCTAQTASWDRLNCQLQSAHAVTVALFRDVMGSAGERLLTLQLMGKTAHIERLLKAGACTEAALALLDLEMPNWRFDAWCSRVANGSARCRAGHLCRSNSTRWPRLATRCSRSPY